MKDSRVPSEWNKWQKSRKSLYCYLIRCSESERVFYLFTEFFFIFTLHNFRIEHGASNANGMGSIPIEIPINL